jgi:hypothetical protein
VHTKFYEDWFRHSKADEGEIQRHSDGDCIKLFYFLNQECRLKKKTEALHGNKNIKFCCKVDLHAPLKSS